MAFFDIFRPARKIENPNTPITAAVIRQALYAGGSYSFDTSPDYGALRYAPVLAAERIITETIASFPIEIYEKLENDGRQSVDDVPQYSLLHDSPNEYQTPFVFWDTVIKTAIRKGNAYIYIERNNGNVPISLLILDPSLVTVRFSAAQGKQFIYKGGEYVIDDADIIHLLGFSNDGLSGVPLTYYASSAISLGMAAEQAALRLFTQGSLTGPVIELDAWPSPEQFKLLVDSWNEAHAGLENAHKVAIIPGGHLNAGNSDIDKMQFLELRRFQVEETARIFRIPPHMLASLDRSTFSNIEQQSAEFLRDTIRPWLIKIEGEINKKMWSPSQQGTYFAEFCIDGLMRADTTARYSAYQIGRQGGWLTINDIRCKENLPPVDGGDELLTPLNMAPVNPKNGGNSAQPEKESAPEDQNTEGDGENGTKSAA